MTIFFLMCKSAPITTTNPKGDLMKTTHKKPFIAYYRVSTSKQGIRGLGITAQRSAVKNYLKDKYPPEYSFKEVESGKKDHRPELFKALDLCIETKGTLIVAKLDRLSRDLHFITSLEKAKIDFVCCDMPQADKFTINMFGVMAQWERDQISKRTKAALKELKRKGKKLGWHNPKIKKALRAYWKANKKPPKPPKIKQKKVVKPRISRADQFAQNLKPTVLLMLDQGLTIEQMAKKLTSMKVITRRGRKKWGCTQVVRLRKRLGL